MFSGSLKTKLVFLFFMVVLLTNTIFAIVGVSREKINSARDLTKICSFLGKVLIKPSLDYFEKGDDKAFFNIYSARSGRPAELKITLYDKNWWPRLGDEARIPLEGFPELSQIETSVTRTGNENIAKEFFFPIRNAESYLGAIGIGLPLTEKVVSGASTFDFIIILVINLFIGVIAAILLSRSILQPLDSLMEGIDAFASGNYALRVPTNGQGELKELCSTFNRKAATVQENVKENLIRNRMLDEKVQELWEIYELTKNMSLGLDLKKILLTFLEKAQTLSFSAVAQIIMRDPVSNKLEIQVSSDVTPDIKIEDYDNLLNACFREGITKEKISSTYSMIFIPLLSGGNIHGVLFLAKRDRSEYSEGIKRFLLTISPVAASIIDNVRLYQEISEWNTNVKNIIESVNTGLGAIDRKGNLILSNEPFFRILAGGSATEKHENIGDIVKQFADQNFARQLDLAARSFMLPVKDEDCRDKTIRFKTSFELENHSVCEVEVRVFPLLVASKVRGCVIVLDDITEQRRIEHQMVESEKWAVLGKLAASVAHEIRNPLVAIRSLVELIGEEVQGELKEHVSVVLGEVHRLNRVVAELLTFVRPEAAKMSIEDMNRLINELVLLVRHEALRNGIELSVSLPDEPCMMKVDAEKMKQAFLNVLLNGIQAAGQGGKIEIKVTKNNGLVQVSIGNNGPEIPQNMRDKIFEAFFTTKEKGTGIGLAITRKIAQLHNGKIEIESDSGFTQFKFILPARDENNE